mmetsp:Transcript_16230/g.54726  ORF Transcript_16230/g.54726 Transcript_16230/m.54726 type:complete len:91 (+) Transcript_16230:547-819(+)
MPRAVPGKFRGIFAPRRRCTSRNADRLSWIDYALYTPSRLAARGRTETVAPERNIPDDVHPSDHLPLGVRFQFVEAIRRPQTSETAGSGN